MGGGEGQICPNFTILLKDALREKLGASKIQIERAHRVGEKERGTDRTIVAKCSSCKGEQNVLNEARHQKTVMYMRNFPKQLWLLGKKTWRK